MSDRRASSRDEQAEAEGKERETEKTEKPLAE